MAIWHKDTVQWKSTYKFLVAKREWIRPLGDNICRLEDDIIVAVWFEGVACVRMTQGRDQ
jgi:hypothetical protein